MAKQSNRDIFLSGLASLLEEHWQTDVQLKGGDSVTGATISAHKPILAVRSKVFKKMLEQDECKTSSVKETITLSEMKHEEVEALVQFLYSSDFLISSEGVKKHVRSLYLAADKYEIPYLRDLCRNELIASLSLSSALDILELAQIPFDSSLHAAALSYITKNISEIANSDELKSLAVSNQNLTVEILKASVNQSRCNESCRKCCHCGHISKRQVCEYCCRFLVRQAKRSVKIAIPKVFRYVLESNDCKASSDKT